MLLNNNLLERWDSLSSHNNGFLRIDAEHPLEWYIGFEDSNQKVLLLISDFEPNIVHSSKSIILSIRKRADDKWALCFRLIRNEQADVFIRLCSDLIESSRNQENNVQGLEFVVHRYGQWTKLMEVQRTGLLSENERKGLIGELLFLQELISKGVPIVEAIVGWMGPEGADQDFIYSSGWYEVKAIGAGGRKVSISSLEQFSAPLPGKLILYFVDKTAPTDENGFTLNSKIEEIKEGLKSSYVASDLFNEKLLKYGYINLPEYSEISYKLRGNNRFLIDEKFPRLTMDNVPAQITNVNYQLSIPAIEPWKIM
ncbi:PD-(D/E)XK motif protein [Bacillus thuringiensis]|uniref:PD-(D/E)XK motif protein n=1 Tax=Bacillus thuringiensis TaxID=1428 RepID=UPI001FAE52C9|nr:PD-(D/E)XK motif protein [Bacillus thuringiensis]MDM8364268.1 PD-(D/E)XK motif protein [Bacillus thuringiensis]MED2866367.1 PD-(D/E)XK motif protein [Bacillus thuringiensis]